MLELLRNKKVLVVVAHPDDELLGLGASMHRLINEFNVIAKVLILGEGITSRNDKRDVKEWNVELLEHHANIEQARKIIGYKEVRTFNFPDNRFDTVALLDIIKVIEREKDSFLPEVVFTHHGGDLNIDHQRTFEAVMTACRPVPGECVRGIFTFETPSGTEWRASSDPKHFIPNFFTSIREDDLSAKIRGMESYMYEKREFPHPRSPEALRRLAERWGVVVGCQLAEVFCLIRWVHI